MGAHRLGLIALALLRVTAAGAQQLHEVKLVRTGAVAFRFQPSRVEARPGDVLEFVVLSGAPYVVGFEAADLTPADRDLLQSALGGSLRGPVLPGDGSRFRLSVPELSRGSYRFTSLTHVAYRMAGVLVIQ